MSATQTADESSGLADLARVAAMVCQTPLALIVLTEGSRHWFQADMAGGLPVTPGAPILPLPSAARAQSEQQKDALFQVCDARADALLCDSPWVAGDAKVVFFASTVLAAQDGPVLGELWVMDHVARTLTPAQCAALLALARQTTVLLKLQQQTIHAQENMVLMRHAQQQLESRDAEWKKFAHTLSHDLKAPLRGITGYAQEVVQKHQVSWSDRAQFCMKQVLLASRNMNQLIDDLLAFVRIDTEVMTATEVNIAVLVQSVLQDYAAAMSEHATHCNVEASDVSVRLWERGLRRVLGCVIDNAIKFSAQALPPTVTITAAVGDGQCQIRVTDNGIGFDLKYEDRIYGLFSRLVRSSEFEGTGVGLALARKLVDKMGGVITVESAPGLGASFRVSVPCQALAAATPP